jgi:hypothetical protein
VCLLTTGGLIRAWRSFSTGYHYCLKIPPAGLGLQRIAAAGHCGPRGVGRELDGDAIVRDRSNHLVAFAAFARGGALAAGLVGIGVYPRLAQVGQCRGVSSVFIIKSLTDSQEPT